MTLFYKSYKPNKEMYNKKLIFKDIKPSHLG